MCLLKKPRLLSHNRDGLGNPPNRTITPRLACHGPILRYNQRMRNYGHRMTWIAIGFGLAILSIILAADLGWGGALFDWVACIPGRDFTAHFILIGLLSLTVNLALHRRSVTLAGRPFQLGSLILIPLVTLEELSQIWIPTRGFSLLDLAANYLGIGLLGGLFTNWPQRKPGIPREEREVKS
jgi:hypothetical protein